jgi:excinuclease UvrABC ATPase subunit
VIDVMQRLRDAGNSLVVVEHDPQIMLAADRILDMGRARASAAARSCSTARRRCCASETLTADYLGGAQALRCRGPPRRVARARRGSLAAPPSTTSRHRRRFPLGGWSA